MNNTTSLLGSVTGLSSSIIAASGINGAIGMKNMNFSTPLSPPTNLSPMDITPGGLNEYREDSDTAMNTSSGRPSPGPSRQSSIFGNTPSTSTSSPSGAQSATTNTSSIKFPKSASHFSSNVIPPTPPAPTPSDSSPSTSNTKTSPRQSRPQLTSRLSSRSGGKRHASIGSSRELPFPGPPPSVPSSVPASESAASSPSLTQVANPPVPNESATPGWNARLREMGLHIPKIGSPGRVTPRTPRSGSMSSGAASPKSPEEQRVASYFSFRRRGSSGNITSPGKARTTAATPPPPPPAAPTLKHHAPEAAKRQQPKPSPISEETSSPASPAPKHLRANLSLDLSATLTARGSTASLPLIGHTPIQHLVQDESRPRRASMIAPFASPPHVHTPPVQPPAYEYPFLPHHPPRQPLEIRVEENPPGPNTGEAGSWTISVRLPGFHSDGITVGTRRGRVLMIVADNYNDDDGGHFERRISFGYDADMANIRAEFNGDMLQVTVPRRWMFGPAMMMPRNTLGAGGGAARPTIENPRESGREKY